MTQVLPPSPDTAEASPEPDADGDTAFSVPIPTAGTGARALRRRRQARRRQMRRTGFAATLTVLALAIPVLGYVGFRAVLTSEDGRVIDPVLDPHEPGYEAVVEPTPVALVAHVSTAGEDPNASDDIPAQTLIGLSVLALGPLDTGGGVLLLPVTTLTDNTARFGFDDLAGAFLVGGLDGVRQATANLLGTSITEAVTVHDDRWAELVAPIAPIEVANPDDVVELNDSGEAEVVFPAGEIELAPDDVGRYLTLAEPGEGNLALLVRNQVFWAAWLDQVRAAGDPGTAVPGEGASGLARFVRGLSAGESVVEPLPVRPRPSSPGSLPGGSSGSSPPAPASPGDPDGALVPIDAEVRSLVARLVPFPTSANPGDRLRLRVLDGTGTDGAAEMAGRRLVPNGAEIVVIGNADRFDYAATQVRYPEGLVERAEEVLEALGVGELAPQSSGNDTVDVTVVVGRDLLEAEPSARSVETGTTRTGAPDRSDEEE